MNAINEELKLNGPDNDKQDDEYVYPFKCQDYIINCFLILMDFIVHAMFSLCIIKTVISMYSRLTLIKTY